jgi:hypothetical protein
LTVEDVIYRATNAALLALRRLLRSLVTYFYLASSSAHASGVTSFGFSLNDALRDCAVPGDIFFFGDITASGAEEIVDDNDLGEGVLWA